MHGGPQTPKPAPQEPAIFPPTKGAYKSNKAHLFDRQNFLFSLMVSGQHLCGVKMLNEESFLETEKKLLSSLTIYSDKTFHEK